ncbi:MAG: DUF6632 domain-containing protein [Longimicrobiales bacterium]
MSHQAKDRALRTVLKVTGLIFIFGIGTLMRLWPAGFAWTPSQSEYELMFVAVYATLGVFLLIASRDPEQHRSLILFTGWSSVAHGLVMAGQALVDASEHTHLIGDVPALVLIGAGLLVLVPRRPVRVAEPLA